MKEVTCLYIGDWVLWPGRQNWSCVVSFCQTGYCDSVFVKYNGLRRSGIQIELA